MEQQRLYIHGPRPSRDRHLQALLAPARRDRVARPADGDLHRCRECSSDLVHPTDWAQAGDNRWHVELRCPECETHTDGVYDQDVLDRFDAELDSGSAALIDDLAELTRANMEDQVERFCEALHTGQVLPEDF